LEKEKSNTSEDFFNRSELIFEEGGIEKTFQVLYVRYFEEILHELTPFKQNPIYKVGTKDIYLRDIVALVYFITTPSYRHRKQVYINTQREFSTHFQQVNFEKLLTLVQEIEEKKACILRSPLEYML
jgi:hypothetical protein